MEIFKWVSTNYQEILISLASLVAFLEVVVRLTPTKKDDGAVERIGSVVKKLMDFFKVPNVKKND